MFNQQKKVPVQVGDVVIVGSRVIQNGKTTFRPIETFGEKITVESIVEESPGYTCINLTSKHGKSKVYAHDEGKLWHKMSNFN